MRKFVAFSALVLAACVSPSAIVSQGTTTLIAADAATQLAVGERIVEDTSTQAASEGVDPIINLTLRHADGRHLSFQQGNHTAHDLLAQQPGGPLAQIMGLTGEEAPTLYNATRGESDAVFFCGPEGPALIGLYVAPDGALQIVGLKQPIQFETRPDGLIEAIPYSPDQVCARLRFRRG